MRKHIAKALQARSKAVKNAIDRFNTAASLLSPPMPELNWDQVVDYAFVADFDILRDTRAEIQSRPWTRPAYRLAMDQYFKTLRAREEIQRLNIEIPRVVTWIRDENRCLRAKEAELREVDGKTAKQIKEDVGLAVQVRSYRERRGRFDQAHLNRFWAMKKTVGFTASLVPGTSVERRAARREARAAAQAGVRSAVERANGVDSDDEGESGEDIVPSDGPMDPLDVEQEGEEDIGLVARDSDVSGLVYTISMLAVDDARGPGGD